MFNIYLGIFIVLAILGIAGGTYKIYSGGQSLAALIFFAGILAVFIIFGMKWFDSDNSLFSKTPVSWPPMINTCPDYLVYYNRKKPDGTTEESCVDFIGVSKNGTLAVFPKDNKTNEPPATDNYYFSLTTRSSQPAGRRAELCQRAIAFGLTWEGITNGESCTTPDGPVAPGGGGSGGDECPTL